VLLLAGCYDTFIATLKAQSNGPSYSNTVIGTLADDGGLLHLVQRGGDWAERDVVTLQVLSAVVNGVRPS